MKEMRTKAVIYAVDQLKIKYPVCYIEQIYFENDTFKYIFKPYYEIIKLLDNTVFQGIPGLNLDLEKELYIRENKIPTFIYERTPQKNREDLWDLLDEVGLEFLDHLEWLIRTNKTYTGDNFVVEAYHKPEIHTSPTEVNYGDQFLLRTLGSISSNNLSLLKFLLDVITQGASLKTDGLVIDNQNRHSMHTLIYTLYKNEITTQRKKQMKGIQRAKDAQKYSGRKKIDVSLPLLEEIIEKRERKEISIDDAMKELGIKSRSTLYRRIREFKESVTPDETN